MVSKIRIKMLYELYFLVFSTKKCLRIYNYYLVEG